MFSKMSQMNIIIAGKQDIEIFKTVYRTNDFVHVNVPYIPAGT